jgi:hypothetical protein
LVSYSPGSIDSKNGEAIPISENIKAKIRLFLRDLKLKFLYKELETETLSEEEFSIKYEQAYETALNSCFMMILPENYFGKTLCNNMIVIAKLDRYSDEIIEAATIILFLHEFAHYYQRFRSQTVEENFIFSTLPTKTSSKDGSVEAGRWLEDRFLGPKFLGLTQVGSLYFLENFLLQPDLNEFSKEFKKKNKRFSQENKIVKSKFLTLAISETGDFLCISEFNCYNRR